jgi:hypothetical protein
LVPKAAYDYEIVPEAAYDMCSTYILWNFLHEVMDTGEYRPVTEKEAGTEILMRLLNNFLFVCVFKSLQNLHFISLQQGSLKI